MVRAMGMRSRAGGVSVKGVVCQCEEVRGQEAKGRCAMWPGGWLAVQSRAAGANSAATATLSRSASAISSLIPPRK